MRDTKAVPGINPTFLEGVLQEHMAEMRKIRETIESMERMFKNIISTLGR